MNPDPPLDLSCPLSAIPASPFCRSCFPFIHSCLTLLSIMLPFNRSWIHQLDRGRVTVRRSSGTITPYLVAQRCRTVLKGGTYGDFSSPESTATNYPVSRTRRSAHETTLADSFVSRTRRLAHETTSEDHSVSRTRRLAHETTSADPSVSRTRLFTHETTSELSCATGTLRALLDAAEVRPEPVRLIERLGAFRDGDLDG